MSRKDQNIKHLKKSTQAIHAGNLENPYLVLKLSFQILLGDYHEKINDAANHDSFNIHSNYGFCR